MPRPLPATFARFVSLPENRSAFLAVQSLAATVGARPPIKPAFNPVYVHGPAGCGKSYLVSALAEEVTRLSPRAVVAVHAAGDLEALLRSADAGAARETDACEADLWIVEDVQHLGERAASAVGRIFDHRLARQGAMVFTATGGPARLELPARLRSRLAGGLVVGIEPLQVPSRLVLLQDKAQRRQLAVGRDILAWLAGHFSTARQLESALGTLETLVRSHGRRLDVAAVAEHFQDVVEATRPTVERIAQRVGRYFRVPARQLQSERRGRSVVLPRQVSMYLARRLTPLSLDQIGDYFGGRDHSTVLYACRKVEEALTHDPNLSGAVRQLQSELA